MHVSDSCLVSILANQPLTVCFCHIQLLLYKAREEGRLYNKNYLIQVKNAQRPGRCTLSRAKF